jgi:hypothetical protein
MVLNGMADLMGGNGDSGEGFPIEFIGSQADGFSVRVVMVALLGHLHFDVLQIEPIKQVSRELRSSSRIVRTGHAMLGKHPPGP